MAKDFLTDEEMTQLEQETTPDFMTDEEMEERSKVDTRANAEEMLKAPEQLSQTTKEMATGAPVLEFGKQIGREAFVKPLKTVGAGFYGNFASTADMLNSYSDKIAQASGHPEFKNQVLDYLSSNWGDLSKRLESEGLSEGFAKDLYKGIGSAVPQFAKYMSGGKFGMALVGAIEGGAEGGIKGAVRGGIEGFLLQKTYGALQKSAPMVKYPSAFAMGAGETAVQGGTPSQILASGTLGAGMVAGGSKETNAELIARTKAGFKKGSVEGSKDIVTRIMKPFKKDYRYDADPEGAVLKENIQGGNPEQLAESIDKKIPELKERGKIILNSPKGQESKVNLWENGADILKPLRDLRERVLSKKPYGKASETVLSKIDAIEKNIEHNVRRITGNEKIGLNSASQATEIKDAIGDLTEWENFGTVEKDVNSAVSQVYGRTRRAIEEVLPEMGDVNQSISGLITAKHGLEHQAYLASKRGLDMIEKVGLLGSVFAKHPKAILGVGAYHLLKSPAIAMNVARTLYKMGGGKESALKAPLPSEAIELPPPEMGLVPVEPRPLVPTGGSVLETIPQKKGTALPAPAEQGMLPAPAESRMLPAPKNKVYGEGFSASSRFEDFMRKPKEKPVPESAKRGKSFLDEAWSRVANERGSIRVSRGKKKGGMLEEFSPEVGKTQIELLKDSGLSEDQMVKFANDRIADGAEWRKDALAVASGKMKKETAIEHIKTQAKKSENLLEDVISKSRMTKAQKDIIRSMPESGDVKTTLDWLRSGKIDEKTASQRLGITARAEEGMRKLSTELPASESLTTKTKEHFAEMRNEKFPLADTVGEKVSKFSYDPISGKSFSSTGTRTHAQGIPKGEKFDNYVRFGLDYDKKIFGTRPWGDRSFMKTSATTEAEMNAIYNKSWEMQNMARKKFQEEHPDWKWSPNWSGSEHFKADKNTYIVEDSAPQALDTIVKKKGIRPNAGKPPIEVRLTTLRELAEKGKEAKDWYKEQAQAIVDAVGKDNYDKFLKVFAETSTSMKPDSNFAHSMKATYQHLMGKEISAGLYPKNTRKNIMQIFEGKEPDWMNSETGLKKQSFYETLKMEADKYLGLEYAKPAMTVQDMWMTRIFGYKKGTKMVKGQRTEVDLTPTEARYRYMDKMTKELAENMGVDYWEAQAMMWTGKQKELGRVSKTVLEGLKDYEVSIGKEWITEAEQNLTLPEKMLFTDYMQDKFMTQEGRSKILDLMGVDAKQYQGIGGWENKFNPSIQSTLYANTINLDSAVDLPMMERVASAMGYIANQDAVFISKPVKTGGYNAGFINIGRPLNIREAEFLSRKMAEQGISGFSPSKDGLRFVDTSKSLTPAKIKGILNNTKQAFREEFGFEGDIDFGNYKDIGKVVEGGSNGEGYLSRFNEQSESSLIGRLNDYRNEAEQARKAFHEGIKQGKSAKEVIESLKGGL